MRSPLEPPTHIATPHPSPIPRMIRRTIAVLYAAALLGGCAGLAPIPLSDPATSPITDTLATLTAAEKVTCLTTTAGAGYCWGDIGAEKGTPVRVRGGDGAPARVRSIAPSFLDGVCAVMFEGEAWCDPNRTGGWVDSAGTTIARLPGCGQGGCVLPLPVRGGLPPRSVHAVVQGWFHACALADDGAAYCWGRNRKGELGRGTWTPDSTEYAGSFIRAPAATTGGVRFRQISARESLTCGVAIHNRGVYCWGDGQSGQAGDSTIMRGCHGAPPYANRACSTAVPVRVLPDSVSGVNNQPTRVAFVQVSSGGQLACAVDTLGQVFCWGDGIRCTLGRCTRGDSPRAQYVALPGFAVEVQAGGHHACARTADARVFCWGDNSYGQLGSLATANAGPDGGPPVYGDSASAAVRPTYSNFCPAGGRCSPAAVEVAPGSRWFALAVGRHHACALGGDGSVHCWGNAGPVLGPTPRIVTCENRSPTSKGVPCQPSPAPVTGLPRLAPPLAPPGQQAVDARNVRAARVLASRREVRIVFPRETATAWGWSELEDRDYQPSYEWGASIDGMDGERTISLHVGRQPGEGARRFGSPAELVAAGRAEFCILVMVADCAAMDAAASVQDGAVVLTLRDSATVARLVGLRPARAAVWHNRPELPRTYSWDSVQVEYVDPQVPLPDSALRAEGAAARRRYEAARTTILRDLNTPGSWGDEVSMIVGDSTPFVVKEIVCVIDFCREAPNPLTVSGWHVADTTIVRVQAVPDAGLVLFGGRRMPTISVIARRPGRTRVRVLGLTGPSDTLPSRQPVPRDLEVGVVVTPPVARVDLAPRIQTAEVGQPVRLRVRAVDARGRDIPGAPVEVRVEGGRFWRMKGPDLAPIEFAVPGRHTVTASFGGQTDTLLVDVVPARSDGTSP